MSNTWHIYSLTDPFDNRVRYVGKADNIKRRLYRHIYDAIHDTKRNHRVNWIRSVVKSGQVPQLSILESGEGDWVEAEKRWIKNFRDAGYALVNGNDGGEGGLNPLAETCAKLSAATKERWQNSEYHAKMSAATKERWQNPEYHAKMSAAHKGRKMSAENRAKLLAANKGRKMSAENRAKIAASNKARKFSAETCAKLSAAKKGWKPSAETRAKLSASHKGRKFSAETCAKISAAKKGWKPSVETRAKMSIAQKARQAVGRNEGFLGQT